MITLPVSTITVSQSYDLRTLAVRDWPEEVRDTARWMLGQDGKRFAADLFPREALVARLEKWYSTSMEDLLG